METILIADPSETLRRMLRAVLEGAGFRVAEAADGAEAIQVLTRDAYGLVLTDLRLPNSGPKLLETVKDVDPSCRVIIMTSYGEIQSAVRAVREGAYGFLTKPIDPDRLLQTVQRALEGRFRARLGGGPGPTRAS